MQIKVGVSVRHVHLNEEVKNILFGSNFNLEIKSNLIQVGEYASNVTVDIKTSKNIIKNVRVLGPLRAYTQVEISKTDAYLLGIDPPVRNSGDLQGSSPITIIGPNGEVSLDEGCIIAKRHIHLNDDDIKKYGFDLNKQYKAYFNGSRGGTLNNIVLKSSPVGVLELHLDTDEANALGIVSGDLLELGEDINE